MHLAALTTFLSLFFSCIVGRVRDIVGQQRDENENEIKNWDLVFEHILRQCGYLVEFQTVYIMVDDRDLANCQRRDSSLPH